MVMVATPVEVDGAVEVYVNQRFIVNFVVRFSTSRCEVLCISASFSHSK